jgi:8-oxo-dGTP diphosphatase
MKDNKKELNGKWSLPGGHIDKGEIPEEAVKREVLEETDLTVNSCSLRQVRKEDKCVIHFFSCCVEQDQLDLILNNDEHFNFKWVNREELRELDCIYDLKEVLNEIAFEAPIATENNTQSIGNDLTKSIDDELNIDFDDIIEKGDWKNHKYLRKIEKSMEIIKQAFDNGQISENKYLGALHKAHTIDIKITIDDGKHSAEVSKPEVEDTKSIEISADKISKPSYLAPSIIEYITHLRDINGDEKQKAFYQWQLLNAKQVKLMPIKDIRVKYPQVDKFLKEESALMKQCFVNAAKLATSGKSILYVEGFISINGAPMEYAFNKIGEDYFDITKDFADLTLSDNSEDIVEDCTSVMELDSHQLLQYLLTTESYGSFTKQKFDDDNKIEKAAQPAKIGDEKEWHGRKFKYNVSGWTHSDEKNGALKTEKGKEKLKIQDFSDEELELHAHRSSVNDLQKIVKEGRNPKLRELAQKHLATRSAKETEHSLYDIMVLEEKEGDHNYATDENTIHFDKELDSEIAEKLNKHGIKYLINSSELKSKDNEQKKSKSSDNK